MNITPDKALESVLRAALARELAGKAMGWAFQLSRNATPLATVCEGYARAPWEDEFPALPMSPDLRLHMASMSKSITACAVMLAIDDWTRARAAITAYWNTVPGGGKPDDAGTFVIAKNLRLHPAFVRKVRDLTDFGIVGSVSPNVDFPAVNLLKYPYGRFLPPASTLGVGAGAVTVKQLMMHQSGINYDGINWHDEWSDSFDVALFLRDAFARKTDPIYNGYQGGNSVILRWIVEGLTETPFHEYVKLRILQPAGARHMSPSLYDDGPERRALHYWSVFTKLADDNVPALRSGNSMPDRYYFYAAGAGGYWGSVAEINLWLQQLLDPAATVYSPAARAGLLGQGLLSGGSSMTMPWGLTVLKNGSAFGCNSCLAVVESDRLSAVLIVNNHNIDAQGALVRSLGAVFPEIRVPTPNTRAKVRISNPLGVGDIRYTDDGSDPATSAASRLYTAEFTPAVATGRIRAVVMAAGRKYTGEAVADFRDIGIARNADTVTGPRAGVAFRVSDGLYLVKLPPALAQRFVTGVASRTSTWPAAAPPRPYSIEYIGFVNAPAEREYKFTLTSDDGSKFWIGQAGSENLLIDNDGLHGDQVREGSIMLKAGRHRFRVEFFQLGGGASLALDWDYAAQPLANALETDDPAAASQPALTALSPASIQRNGTRRVQLQGSNLREITKMTSVPALSGQSTITLPGGGSGTSVPLDFVLESNVTIGAYTLTIEFGAISRTATINVTA